MAKVVDPTNYPFLRVAACSYEGSIFGWNIEENAEQLEMSAKLTFGFNATAGSLKAIACSQSGKYLVVGGVDERIRIFDMYDNKSIGELSQHTASITALKFYKDSNLMSASEVNK
jgi:WD40 repeat protein